MNSDRMTIREEMREHERREDLRLERALAAAPHCPTHGQPFIGGVGIGKDFYPAKPGGECPTCLRERYGIL